MSRLLRIAAREYLSYVRTVGFWLSLVAMPLVLSASLAIPSLMDRTAPPTRLAIIDLTHQGYGAALAARLARDPPGRGYILVAPPADVQGAPDAASASLRLRQRLAGDAGHDRAGRSFDTAALISRDGRVLTLTIWTTNLIDGRMQAALHDHLADLERRQRLLNAGVSARLIDKNMANRIQVVRVSRSPAPRVETSPVGPPPPPRAPPSERCNSTTPIRNRQTMT